MISDIVVRPKAQNDLGRRVFILTMIAAALSFAVSLWISHYSGIVQLVALIFLCASLYFYTRYVASVYSYEITTDSDGAVLFVVRQTGGNRSTTHCRMTLSSLVRAEMLGEAEMKLYRKNRQRTREANTPDSETPEYLRPDRSIGYYDYCATFRPRVATLLCFRSHTERADLLVEVSEELRTMLLDEAARLRELLEQDSI